MIHQIPGYLTVNDVTGTVDFTSSIPPAEGEKPTDVLRIAGLPVIPPDFDSIEVGLDDDGNTYEVLVR